LGTKIQEQKVKNLGTKIRKQKLKKSENKIQERKFQKTGNKNDKKKSKQNKKWNKLTYVVRTRDVVASLVDVRTAVQEWRKEIS
jgi:hypothetical protein